MTKPDIDVHPMALRGKTVVITGVLEDITRKEAQELVEEAGGKVTGSVSKNTHLLISGDKAGSKLTKAKELEIEVISESIFLERIEYQGFNPEDEGYFELVKGSNEWVRFDGIHGGELWFTQANQDIYGAGEDEIDWEEYKDVDGNLDEVYKADYDAGYRWRTYTEAIDAGEVLDHNGVEIREDTEDDTLVANGIDPAAYHAEGCELQGSWGDG
jgi:hypothetical protein